MVGGAHGPRLDWTHEPWSAAERQQDRKSLGGTKRCFVPPAMLGGGSAASRVEMNDPLSRVALDSVLRRPPETCAHFRLDRSQRRHRQNDTVLSLPRSE